MNSYKILFPLDIRKFKIMLLEYPTSVNLTGIYIVQSLHKRFMMGGINRYPEQHYQLSEPCPDSPLQGFLHVVVARNTKLRIKGVPYILKVLSHGAAIIGPSVLGNKLLPHLYY